MKSPFPVLMARLPMLILALVIASFANRAEPQTFETQQWQQGYSIIDSQWRFHPGDDPAWASPTFAKKRQATAVSNREDSDVPDPIAPTRFLSADPGIETSL